MWRWFASVTPTNCDRLSKTRTGLESWKNSSVYRGPLYFEGAAVSRPVFCRGEISGISGPVEENKHSLRKRRKAKTGKTPHHVLHVAGILKKSSLPAFSYPQQPSKISIESQRILTRCKYVTARGSELRYFILSPVLKRA